MKKATKAVNIPPLREIKKRCMPLRKDLGGQKCQESVTNSLFTVAEASGNKAIKATTPQTIQQAAQVVRAPVVITD